MNSLLVYFRGISGRINATCHIWLLNLPEVAIFLLNLSFNNQNKTNYYGINC